MFRDDRGRSANGQPAERCYRHEVRYVPHMTTRESRVFACTHKLGRHYCTILLAQGKYVNLRMTKKVADEMRLSHEDLPALLEAILKLHECPDRHSFRRVLPGVFLELVPGDDFRFREYQLDFARRAVRLVDWVDSGRPKMRQGAVFPNPA
jgi:hypothetical protein